MLVTSICQHEPCGETFIYDHVRGPRRRFCSASCRRRYHSAKSYAKAKAGPVTQALAEPVTQVCEYAACGKEFTYRPLNSVKRKYCGPTCRQRAQYARQQGAHSAAEVLGLMRKREARISARTDGHDEGRGAPKRCCAYDFCITRLCRYNPGPYCFMHAQRIQDLALADMQRKQEQRQATQAEEAHFQQVWRSLGYHDREIESVERRADAA